MRLLVTSFAMLALAAVPCAWDSAPGEPPPIAALFSLLSPSADAGAKQFAQSADTVLAKATPESLNDRGDRQ
ncbi:MULTISPECIES: hypothetical protein [unclassified Rhizobium]|uniref:hypothetical protein n=1 Tax=unclassified Rhizobium TaxID=2613769 RepID=UPI00160A18F6|nr:MULTISPECIES: hypothetical protein [unclassified Rhizobium]MBB3541258.1 hypothetical protein [Rhizobium sp. BK399]MCS3739983.1 hypothetical protein [Rhizobium sp. BK661]MCS4092067.1 hypothetical protein [Rhizobium sp. BK176]